MASFIEKLILSPLNFSGIFIINQMTKYTCDCVYGLPFLFHWSICISLGLKFNLSFHIWDSKFFHVTLLQNCSEPVRHLHFIYKF